MNDYYVYEHIRLDNNTCFYVGKGRGKRAYQKKRNEFHDRVANKCGMKVQIVKQGLSELEAYELERKLIKHYVEDLKYGIAIEGYNVDLSNGKYLTNHTMGGDGSFGMVHTDEWCKQHSLDMSGKKNPMYGINNWETFSKEKSEDIKNRISAKVSGINNPMYGISPEERMDPETYKRWLNKTHNRLKNQYGKNNPNYGNDTLKKKLEANPELKVQYYARNGAQNGTAKAVKVYDKNHKFLREFPYIGACCEWMQNELGITSKIDSLRSRIRIVAKQQTLYKNMYFKYK